MILKRMLKEQYRMQADMYKGRYFKLFPLTVFAITLVTLYPFRIYSELAATEVTLGLTGFSVLLGLAAGMVGFSSRDEAENLIGDRSLLVYTSRTLPISQNKLLGLFVLNDAIYYSLMFIIPIFAGFSVAYMVFMPIVVLKIFAGFLGGAVVSFILSRTGMHSPSLFNLSYVSERGALTSKTIEDVSRSAGGLLKIFFTLLLLTGVYWLAVLNLPFEKVFMQNPLITYSVLLGMSTISVYNWVNRFDEEQDYLHLPINREMLVKSKFRAFVFLSVPLTTLFLGVSAYFYSGQFALSLLALYASTFVSLSLVSYLTGLNPNSELYDSKVFLKYVVLNSFLLLPIAVTSIVLQYLGTPVFIGVIAVCVTVSGLLMYRGLKS
ncbi:MAG: hypothetical protein ACI977_000412 [Candidatus Nanohaloarchaea archaeon]|jgi:hypothetical protein